MKQVRTETKKRRSVNEHKNSHTKNPREMDTAECVLCIFYVSILRA